jgi:hypothetical protein
MDLLQNKTIDVSQNGTNYIFRADSTQQFENRFKIVARHYEKNSPDEDSSIKLFSSNGTIFAQNMGEVEGDLLIYDIAGRYIKNTPIVPYGISTVKGLLPGAYIAKAKTGTNEVSKRLIVRK